MSSVTISPGALPRVYRLSSLLLRRRSKHHFIDTGFSHVHPRYYHSTRLSGLTSSISKRNAVAKPSRETCRHLFSKTNTKTLGGKSNMSQSSYLITTTALILGGGVFYILLQNDYVQPLPATKYQSQLRAERKRYETINEKAAKNVEQLSTLPYKDEAITADDDSSWSIFSSRIAALSSVSDAITDFILPDWAKTLPGYIQKLQRELSVAPGSLANEIWQEAHDPYINPEIQASATVRVSSDLCDEELEFRRQRLRHTTKSLAKYLEVPEEDIHPDDVPCIAMVGSGGGLRALIASTASFLATREAGLFDCVTYTAGVSGSCWLQALYHSSLGGRRFDKIIDHLKSRLTVHIAYPPVALSALISAPTNKFLLSGFVEKLKGDATADFGLVDIYGLLLAARLLVPKGELGVDDKDLKISNQRAYIKYGEHPMPIYTAVRHEIPIIEEESEAEKQAGTPSEASKEKAKQEAWFQWFEISPYEMFCEEFSAGIPTWAIGRKFQNGRDVPNDTDGMRVPEYRLSLMLGIFGSAFCATLSHYYKEIRPLVKSLTGFGSIDDIIDGRDSDLSKVHPIDPASIPNFALGMRQELPPSTPESTHNSSHIQLMDAGMSNNLPIYPLLRPGRDVDILIAFDASADIKTDNWLSVADGYARQRGIKGWPLGAGWPKDVTSADQVADELEEAQASSVADADAKINDAKAVQEQQRDQTLGKEGSSTAPEQKATIDKRSTEDNSKNQNQKPSDLGYCNVWVGSTAERSPPDTEEPPKSKDAEENWQLMEPDAGIAVVYFPFVKNEAHVAGVDPQTSDFMSTWNFVYTPEQIDKVVGVASANFDEGREKTRRVVRAVWQRKKKSREEREEKMKMESRQRKIRSGVVGGKGTWEQVN